MNDINEQAAEKIVELGALLLEVLEKDPFIISSINGDYNCYYCGCWDVDGKKHYDGCLYVRIRKVIGFKPDA